MHFETCLVDDKPVTELWWRGCKANHDGPLGCDEKIIEHTGYDIVEDECTCKTELCNKKMGPIPPSI